MAQLGFISTEFPSASLNGCLAAMAKAGATTVQLDLASATGATFPAELPEDAARAITASLAAHRLGVAGLSGTYNMIHPDRAVRQAGARDLARLIAVAPAVGARVITLCTGTRDPDNMWRRHPGNDAPDAWTDLRAELDPALEAAERHGVVLAVEPEICNTVNSVQKAGRLIDEVDSRHLGICMDGANIFQAGELPRMRQVLDRAFELLGEHIVLAHAKDLDRDGDAGHLPAGRGRLDYPHYLNLLQRSGYDGDIILHSLAPAEAADRLAFVRQAAPLGYVAATGR